MCASWLCTHANVILLPKLRVKEGVQLRHKDASGEVSYHRNLGKDTVRSMLNIAHCKFFARLERMTSLFQNCKLLEVDEAYTTQQCGRCKSRYKPPGETYKCRNKNCGYVGLRDGNAARQILLRWLVLTDEALAQKPATSSSSSHRCHRNQLGGNANSKSSTEEASSNT